MAYNLFLRASLALVGILVLNQNEVCVLSTNAPGTLASPSSAGGQSSIQAVTQATNKPTSATQGNVLNSKTASPGGPGATERPTSSTKASGHGAGSNSTAITSKIGFVTLAGTVTLAMLAP